MVKYLLMLVMGFLMFSQLFIRILMFVMSTALITVLTFPRFFGVIIIIFSILRLHKIHRSKNEDNY